MIETTNAAGFAPLDRALLSSPQFLRTSYVITSAWSLAFLLLVLADLILLLAPEVPMKVGV